MFSSKRQQKRAGIFSTRGHSGRSGTRHRRLSHEPLESRVVLSASPLVAAESVTDSGDPATACEAGSAASLQDSTSLERFASAEELKQYLIEDALSRWAVWFGRSDEYVVICRDTDSAAILGYSQTNVQVAGVDEPDVVETDGRYLYSLAPQELIVREIGADGQPEIVARLTLGEDLRGMLLTGNRLTILAQRNKAVDPSDVYAPQTEVIILDVSDPTDPSLIERSLVDGAYEDARAVGDRVYLVSQSQFFLPRPRVIGGSTGGKYDPGAIETKEEYLARIEDQVLDLVLPTITTVNGEGEVVESRWLAEPTEIYRPQSDEQNQLRNVVVFDVGDDQQGPLDAMAVVGDDATEMYLSDEGLFVLGADVRQWAGWLWFPERFNAGNDTSILKFSVDGETGKIALAAAGTVQGRLLDQFSFDAYEGYLRIATTVGAGSEAANSLYVLQQNGEGLEVVGEIENIAPGEQLYAARFFGERAYLVTFRKVDPLFSVDLSDPAAPEIVGELEIPGFSNYLHDVGDGFLLGLGRDASTETGLFADPQVSLFDVSDAGDPQLAARYTIPIGRDGGLNLFDDHHEVAYFPEYGILTLVAPAPGETSGEAVWVFKIDTSASAIDNGTAIELLTTIQHPESFWLRSVRMGDKLVVSSARQVTVHDLATPAEPLASDAARTLHVSDSRYYKATLPDLADGDYLFTLEAQNTGFLTFDAQFERTELKDATLTLYDWRMNELAVSESDFPWAEARLDWQAEAGERFFVKVSGTATDVEFRVVNTVSIEGQYQDSVLRIVSPSPDADVDFKIYWYANSGKPWKKDQITLQVLTRRLSLDVGDVHYDIGMYTPNVVIEGSGSNAITVDVTQIDQNLPTRGDIVADLGDGFGTVSCAGPIFGMTGDGEEFGFRMEIANFFEITVNGGDVAKLRGSKGNDMFTATPGLATMVTEGHTIPADEISDSLLRKWSLGAIGSIVRVTDFGEVHGYSGEGERDTAKLYDTPGNDKFVATPDYAKIRGKDYYARAKGFRYAHGYAKLGGEDTAKLKDSVGEDICIAQSDFVRLRGSDYNNRAKFFENVEVRARGYSGDTAILRDAVLTAETDLADLHASVLFRGMERFKMRGNSTDKRPEAETIDKLLAYWPQ